MVAVTPLATHDALEEVRFLWHARWLETRNATSVQSFAWYRSYTATRRTIQPYALAIREGGSLLGILPLVRHVERIAGTEFRMLTFPSETPLPVHGPVGAERTRIWIAAMTHLRQTSHHWDLVDLRGIDARIDGGRAAAAARLRGLSLDRLTDRADSNWIRLTRHTAPHDLLPSDGAEASRDRTLWGVAEELGTARCLKLSCGDPATVVRFVDEGHSWIVLSLDGPTNPCGTAARAGWTGPVVTELRTVAGSKGVQTVWVPVRPHAGRADGGLARCLLWSPRSVRGRVRSWWRRLTRRVA